MEKPTLWTCHWEFSVIQVSYVHFLLSNTFRVNALSWGLCTEVLYAMGCPFMLLCLILLIRCLLYTSLVTLKSKAHAREIAQDGLGLLRWLALATPSLCPHLCLFISR